MAATRYEVLPGAERISIPLRGWAQPDTLAITAAVIAPPVGEEFRAYVGVTGPKGSQKAFGYLSIAEIERLAYGMLAVAQRIRTREEF